MATIPPRRNLVLWYLLRSHLIAGNLPDHIGRRSTIIIGCGMFSIGCILETASTSLAVMVVGRLIAGSGIGFISAISKVSFICINISIFATTWLSCAWILVGRDLLSPYPIDRVESVFRRLRIGSGITSLPSSRPISLMRNMPTCRPRSSLCGGIFVHKFPCCLRTSSSLRRRE